MSKRGATSSQVEQVFCRAKLRTFVSLATAVDSLALLDADDFPTGGPGNDPFSMVHSAGYITLAKTGVYLVNAWGTFQMGAGGDKSVRLRVALYDSSDQLSYWPAWAEHRPRDYDGTITTPNALQAVGLVNVASANYRLKPYACNYNGSSATLSDLRMYVLRLGLTA